MFTHFNLRAKREAKGIGKADDTARPFLVSLWSALVLRNRPLLLFMSPRQYFLMDSLALDSPLPVTHAFW